MSADTAYRTSDPAVVAAYKKWKADTVAIHQKRMLLSEALGRNAWINGSGYSTHIVGFERFDSDNDGELLADGALIVSSERGGHNGLIVPNLRRKAGKEYAEHLREYTTPALDLPGMAAFHVYSSSAGLVWGHANMWMWDGVIYALWGTDSAPVEDNWETIPLSTYHLAREQYDAAARPVVVTDEENMSHEVARFATVPEAENYISDLPDTDKVERGGYGIDAPDYPESENTDD